MALEQDSYFSIFEDKMIVRKHHRIANQKKTKQNKKESPTCLQEDTTIAT